ncbi:hypothetical protein ACHAQJ_006826 [Trichoderma viride]
MSEAVASSAVAISVAAVLIIGASGYVAAHAVEAFLRKGYNVGGTVRLVKTAAEVLKTHSKYSEQLGLSIVLDIAVAITFDEAVKAVDGPALNCATSVLEATQKYNPEISRVVVLSSFAAVRDPSKCQRPEYVYAEADWNLVTLEQARSSPVLAYLASKIFAERAAFDYVKEKKEGVPVNIFWGFSDVRDLAEAHVLAYEKPEAAGQRYLIANSAYSNQKIRDIFTIYFILALPLIGQFRVREVAITRPLLLNAETKTTIVDEPLPAWSQYKIQHTSQHSRLSNLRGFIQQYPRALQDDKHMLQLLA